MGIRGDMEARYWAEMGHDKPREMAEHFFECLKDPNVWTRMQRDNGLTDSEIVAFLQCIEWVKDEIITRDGSENRVLTGG